MRKYAIVNIYASYNDTIIVATDPTGAETIVKSSGGMITKSQHKEGSAYVAMKVAEQVAENLKAKGFKDIVVAIRAIGGIRTKNTGPGADASITSLTRSGLNILEIKNVTPLPHDGCTKKIKHRGRK